MEWIEGFDRATSLPAVWIVATDERPRTRPERATLRHGVSRRIAAMQCGLPSAEVEIRHEPSGRPFLTLPGGQRFDLSHATRDGVVVVGLAEQPIGVDVERIGAGPVPMQALHRAEQLWLAQLGEAERSERFAALWAAKEAYGKWRGTGLPETDAFALLPEGNGWRVAGAEQARISHRRLEAGGMAFMAAVAR